MINKDGLPYFASVPMEKDDSFDFLDDVIERCVFVDASLLSPFSGDPCSLFSLSSLLCYIATIAF
jgi:hypothetical protein